MDIVSCKNSEVLHHVSQSPKGTLCPPCIPLAIHALEFLRFEYSTEARFTEAVRTLHVRFWTQRCHGATGIICPAFCGYWTEVALEPCDWAALLLKKLTTSGYN